MYKLHTFRLTATSFTAFVFAALLPLTGCVALNQMGEGIGETFQEFTGQKERTKPEGDGIADPIGPVDLGPGVLLVSLNGVNAVPKEPAAADDATTGGAKTRNPYIMTEGVTLPTAFSFAIPGEEAFGEVEYATLKVIELEGGLEKGRTKKLNTVQYSERNGRGSALYAGNEIDLRRPNPDDFKTILAGAPVPDNFKYNVNSDYELQLYVVGTEGKATQKVRFKTVAE